MEDVFQFIQENIVDNRQTFSFKFIQNVYCDKFNQRVLECGIKTPYTLTKCTNLHEKLAIKFHDKITLFNFKNKYFVTPVGVSVLQSDVSGIIDREIVKKAALI